MSEKIKRGLLRFNTLRRAVQFLSFIILSATIFGLAASGLLLPVLWTWGIDSNIVGDAFTALQLMLSGWEITNVFFPWLAVASFLIIGVLLGKSLCGWICPFGLIQDLIDFIKHGKMKISARTHRNLIYIKYAILAITLFVGITYSTAKLMGASRSYERALGVFAKAPFTTLSPAETLFATVPRMVFDVYNATSYEPGSDLFSGISTLPPLFWIQLIIMVSVLVFVALVPRGWCKYLCPHGAIMGIMNKFSFIGLRRDLVKCAKGECRICVEACPMNVRILDLPWKKLSDPECTYCLKCVDVCEHKAIKLTYP